MELSPFLLLRSTEFARSRSRRRGWHKLRHIESWAEHLDIGCIGIEPGGLIQEHFRLSIVATIQVHCGQVNTQNGRIWIGAQALLDGLNSFLRLVELREHFAEIIIEVSIIGLQFYGVSIVGLSLLRIIKLLIGFSKINPGIGMVRFKFRDTLIVA